MIFSLSRIAILYGLCAFIAPLCSMEIATDCSTIRPTIIGKIYINDSDNTARYDSANFHVKLTQKGVKSCIQNPLVSVVITDNTNTVNWTMVVPYAIKSFEERLCWKNSRSCLADRVIECRRSWKNKKFPYALPLLCLYKAKTGTTLSFTLYNYPVELTCINNPQTDKSFEDDLNAHMAAFATVPTYFNDRCFRGSLIEDLMENELVDIKEGRLVHGKKGFVCVEQLILDQINPQDKERMLLLLCVKKSMQNLS